ncbi:MAG: polyprenol monophosphomannose synthase [Thermoplasmata archaeon]|nr:polyprenol monophosphomannose synthase [Thermoplasmata archaeon]MCI4341231.1 polyprenol monophosphomannose synthase [Thermoplasmata archaeon]
MELSVLLPTFNERAALDLLGPRLEAATDRGRCEILVIDDHSPDGTANWVREREAAGRWRVLERPGRAGLASAVIDGFAASSGEIIVVMDADGSHPPELLPALIEPIRSGRAEMTIGSRRLPGGSGPGLGAVRRTISGGATWLARPLAHVTDPMSGFFAIDRRVLGRAPLTPLGYKIGLEVLVKCRPKPVVEVPFRFAARLAGESKLGGAEMMRYLRHLGRLYRWRVVGAGRASSTR